jgi:ribosomal protein S18 acetylase RimI-like enzyme
MKFSVEIRNFVYPDDYPAVLSVWETAGPGLRVGRSDSPQEILKKVQRDPDLFLVAEVAGKIVGTVIGGFDGRRGMVYHLGVLPGYRRSGIGRALMAEVEERLILKGCLKCYLMVVNDNDAAHFYETCGWASLDLQLFAKEFDTHPTELINGEGNPQ